MPGSSAAFRSQWNISKSTLGIETVVLKQHFGHGLGARPTGMCHRSLSCQSRLIIWDPAVGDIPTCIPAASSRRVHISANENISWCFHRLWEHPLAWVRTIGMMGAIQGRFWEDPILDLYKQLPSQHWWEEANRASEHVSSPSVSGRKASQCFFF